MIIRKEQPKDYINVCKLIEKAFASTEHSDGDEHNLVSRLRKTDAFIPELSLVAIKDDKIVGHILFTKVTIGAKTELALAPLSVLPDYQNKGIGKSLINAGHKIAKNMGFEYSIVLGSTLYYPKAGYIPADNFGITPPFDIPKKNFMAINLKGMNNKLNGMVKYNPTFFKK